MRHLLTIRIMLPAVIVVLASLILVTAGIKTYDTFETRAKAGAFLLVNHASDHLLRAAGDLAVERGGPWAPSTWWSLFQRTGAMAS